VKYELLKATERDGKEMLEIIESRPAQGLFEVFYTRRPNPVISYFLENKNSDVYVIKNERGRIAFQAACVPHSVYIGGERKSLGYINGVRKNPGFKEKIDWMRMIRDAETKVDYDYKYCSILLANKHAQEVFEKRREDMPNLNYICDYTTFIIKPRKRKVGNGAFIFRKASKADEQAIVDFLIREGKQYDFFPCFESLDEFYGLSLDDVYILRQNNEILCVCALWEQSGYKQYVVRKYNGILKLAKNFPEISSLFGYIPFPREGEVVKFPTLTLFLAKDDNSEYYQPMLANIENIISEKYDMFLIGLAENNSKFALFEKRKTLSFASKLYLISDEMPKMPKILKIPKISDKIHVECGML